MASAASQTSRRRPLALNSPTTKGPSEQEPGERSKGPGGFHFLDTTTVGFSFLFLPLVRTQPPPYSFRHQLRLTDDVEAFRLGVEEADLAGNIDSPESGMDALMQAITCDRVIGWRTGVRKVIIFITDQDSHFAYDGQLAGLPEPQVRGGKHHLTSTITTGSNTD